MSAKQKIQAPVIQQVDIEISANQIKELTERLARYKERCDELTIENKQLVEIQSASSQDKQDIVEFLSIELKEKDLKISLSDQKALDHELEKNETIQYYEQELEEHIAKSKAELDAIQSESQIQKSELNLLLDFKNRKDEFVIQIENLKITLTNKEEEYQDNLRSIEKKVFQDKTQLKKEMLQKVNEAVSNFRKVADHQMAETTKRAIKENIAINAHLQKMSVKMVELLAENERLTGKLVASRSEGEILKDSEKELAKRNVGHQKIVQMLTEKLRGLFTLLARDSIETDKLLEIAYDTGMMDELSEKKANIMFNVSGQEVEKELSALKEFANEMTVELDDAKELLDSLAKFISFKSPLFIDSPLNVVWLGLQRLFPKETFSDIIVQEEEQEQIESVVMLKEENDEVEMVDDEFVMKPLAFKKPIMKNAQASTTHTTRSSLSFRVPRHHDNRAKSKDLHEDSAWGAPAKTLPMKGLSYMPTAALFQPPL